MNILIIANDKFFSYAIQNILQNYFYAEALITIANKPSQREIAESDVLFLEISPGEQFLCHPYLQQRKVGGKLVLIVKDKLCFKGQTLPHCLGDACVVDNKTSVIDFFYLYSLLIKSDNCSSFTRIGHCYNCPCGYLTPAQLKISYSFMNGINISDIAAILKVSEKTVYTQKKRVMDRFKIKSDQELYFFFRGLRLIHTLPLIKE